MFATRDQENLVHGHQQVAASKPLNQGARGLQPKTPGNKYPKTPLKIPLNDENAPGVFGGKSVKGKGLENLVTGGKKATFDKNAFVTPIGPRTRAPLGAKTTNAKAKAFQTPAGPIPEKGIEKTQASVRRPKKVTHPEAVKIEVHGDESPLTERDVEYAPPKPKDLPYESEDFPDGCLNYEPLTKGNLMGGIYQAYQRKFDENGVSRLDRKLEEAYAKSARETDEAVLKALDEEWTVGDAPETFRHLRKNAAQEQPKAPEWNKKPSIISNRVPATIASRKAAYALSVTPKSAPAAPQTSKPKPASSFLSRSKPTPQPTSSNASAMHHTAATAASRSTIGYTKGRTASGALQTQKRQGGMTRSVSNLSQASDITITPARFAQTGGGLEPRNLGWLGAFDVDDEDLEPGLRGALPECLRKYDDDEEFVMTLGSTE